MPDSKLPLAGDDKEAMNDAICLDGRLPAVSRLVSSLWSDAELAMLNQGNLLLLEALLLMDSQRVGDADDTSCCHQDMQRLEAKTDLLITMVSRLLSRQEGRPPLAAVVLSSQALVWAGGLTHPADSLCEVDLYLSPLAAAPLTLTGRVSEPGRLQLAGIGPALQSALEKYLFRQHRRAVADARNNRQGDSAG